MNEVIQTILSHRSIRSYEDKPLTKEQIMAIIACAQAASTSSYVQAYTIIGIKDPVKKERLAELAGGQAYVAQNGHFLVFCLDLSRLEQAARMESGWSEEVERSLASTETFMVGVIDASLAAQNAAIAAESMGLGVCYIGGLRNQLGAVTELLQTPDRVIPLFGLSIGYPRNHSDLKPRLPLTAVYHEDGYPQNGKELVEGLRTYNDTIAAYYQDRTNGARSDRWTEQMARQLAHPKRLYMKSFLARKKLPLE